MLKSLYDGFPGFNAEKRDRLSDEPAIQLAGVVPVTDQILPDIFVS